VSRVLIVDDEASVRFTLSELVSERGHEPIAVATGDEALANIEQVDVAITDLSMPGMDGFELLEKMHARRPDLPVVMLTARGSERAAVRAMKLGAYDYLPKPFDIDELWLTLERALELVELRRRERRLNAELALGRRIVAEHPAMRRLLESVARVAARDVPVLLQGETGTGKELVASLLHAHSRRRDKPLVRFNCAAVPPELAEAELFGYKRGAFTGAVADKSGFFAQAAGGTLVLDEIGELSLGVQAKLLRALQGGEIQRLGADRVEKVDVRIVASTHRDLSADARAGRFRQDLYYRLAVVVLRVPALRERATDIPALARELASAHALRFGLEDGSLSDDLVGALAARAWPGNVRELENAIVRMLALSDGGALGSEALALLDDDPAADVRASGGNFRQRVEAFERELLGEALTNAGGNQSEAARELGLSRPTFIARAKRFGLL
jgi:DNA-binding NtrC family response regulator